MTWETKIKRVSNGFILMIPNENDEEGNLPENEYDETLFEFSEETEQNVQDKKEAEIFVKLCWELAQHFGIHLNKYNDYQLNMEVKKKEVVEEIGE